MVDVRPIEPSELRSWVEAMLIAYFSPQSPDDVTRDLADRTDFARTIGAFEGGRVVGTLRSFPTELTVPGGGCVVADAVTCVGVLPTHRRQGILGRMMERSLRDAANRGDALSILFASEAPIYGRFGYGPATEHAEILIRREGARFRTQPEGRVELVTWPDLRTIAPVVHERFRRLQPGSIAIDASRWDRLFGIVPTARAPKHGDVAAIYRDDAGEPQGWIAYRPEEAWVEARPHGKLEVRQLIAATPAAYARLWRYALEIDLIAEVRAEQRPSVELLPWLLVDRRAVHQTVRHDGLWVRVLDPVAALRSRTYLASDDLVIEVRDPAGFAAGRVRIEGGPHGAHCDWTKVAPDLSMTVEGLGAAYLGGTKLSILAQAGHVEERRSGTLARAEAMLAGTLVPWSPFVF